MATNTGFVPSEGTGTRALLIPLGLDNLRRAVEQLSETLEGLNTRLIPVSSEVSKKSCSESPSPAPVSCELSGRLVDAAGRIELLDQKAHRMLAELEI